MQSTSASAQRTLLQACGLQFLFRALARSTDEVQRVMFEEQIIRLIADFVPCSGGSAVLGPMEFNVPEDCVTVPLYVHEEPAGALAIWFPPEEQANIPQHLETLTAISTLASAALESATDLESLRTENLLLRARIDPEESGMVGNSPAIRKLMQMIARVAPQQTSVLVQGESGTGKELVARALPPEHARL